MRILEIESWPRERKLGFQVKLGLQLNPPPLLATHEIGFGGGLVLRGT